MCESECTWMRVSVSDGLLDNVLIVQAIGQKIKHTEDNE